MREPRKAAHEMGRGVQLRSAQPVKGRHLRHPRVGVILVADAVAHGIGDILHRAAPKPVIVQKVRIARGHHTPCPRAMTLRTIRRKDRTPRLHSETVQFFVVFQNSHIDVDQAFRQIGIRQIDTRNLSRDLATGGIAQQPRRRARNHRPRGIEDGIDDAPDDGGVECPKPPPRQGRVQLFDAIPAVARGFGAGGGVDLAVVGHWRAPSLRAWSGSSLRNGTSAASSCSAREPGR